MISIKYKEKYAPKFAAANEYAKHEGWEFRVIDETQIRIPRLSNLKFLRSYRNFHPRTQDAERVLELAGRKPTSSLSLFNKLADSDESKMRWLPVIWSMLAMGSLTTDMDHPFGGDVPLRLAGDA